MDPSKIMETKEKILDIAAEIIMEDGYQNLSMRKIGSRIGMTAANLYNYYSNKDELNIAIRTRAGKILYKALYTAYETGSSVFERIRLMSKAYIEFGLIKANYYSIMFDMPTPKYADYVDSPLEQLAFEEKVSSEQSLELLAQCTKDIKQEGYIIPENPDLFLIIIWSQLHGLISLYNNKLMSEINENPDKTIGESAGLAYDIFISYLSNKK